MRLWNLPWVGVTHCQINNWLNPLPTGYCTRWHQVKPSTVCPTRGRIRKSPFSHGWGARERAGSPFSRSLWAARKHTSAWSPSTPQALLLSTTRKGQKRDEVRKHHGLYCISSWSSCVPAVFSIPRRSVNCTIHFLQTRLCCAVKIWFYGDKKWNPPPKKETCTHPKLCS